jgi:hypothetical protein
MRLFFGEDDATPTAHPKILRARDGNTSSEVSARVDTLIAAAQRRESKEQLCHLIHALVPEYQPTGVSDGSATRRGRPSGSVEVIPVAPATATHAARPSGRTRQRSGDVTGLAMREAAATTDTHPIG